MKLTDLLHPVEYLKRPHPNRNFSSFFTSLIASFIVLNAFYSIDVVLIILVVALFHEFGHWIVGHALNLDPKLPIFIPLGICIVGITNLKKDLTLTVKKRALLHTAGFLSSMILLLTLLATPLIAISYLSTILLLSAYETINMVIGKDGSRLRNEYRRHRINTTNAIPAIANIGKWE